MSLKTIRCPKCGEDNPLIKRYCIVCGANLTQQDKLRSSLEDGTPASVKVPYEQGFYPELRFSEYCIYCCQPATTYKAVHLSRQFTVGYRTKRTIQLHFTVPYCEQHKTINDTIAAANESRQHRVSRVLGVCTIAGGIVGAIAGGIANALSVSSAIPAGQWVCGLGVLGSGLGFAIAVGLQIFDSDTITGVSTQEKRDYHTILGLNVQIELQHALLTFTNPSYAGKYVVANQDVHVVP